MTKSNQLVYLPWVQIPENDSVVGSDTARSGMVFSTGASNQSPKLTELVQVIKELKPVTKRSIQTELKQRNLVVKVPTDETPTDETYAYDYSADLITGESEFDEVNDQELSDARALAEHRRRHLVGLDRVTVYRRLSGYLQRRGYSSGVIRIVIAEFKTSSVN